MSPSRALAAFAALLVGCAAFPSVEEVAEPCRCGGGLVVNARATYAVVATVPGGSPFAGLDVATDARLTGVAQGTRLVLDLRRMPFSSATLGVELLPTQVPEKISVTGRSGAPAAAKAAQVGAETYQAVEEAGGSTSD